MFYNKFGYPVSAKVFSYVIGRRRLHRPVAAKIALAIAAGVDRHSGAGRRIADTPVWHCILWYYAANGSAIRLCHFDHFADEIRRQPSEDRRRYNIMIPMTYGAVSSDTRVDVVREPWLEIVVLKFSFTVPLHPNRPIECGQQTRCDL